MDNTALLDALSEKVADPGNRLAARHVDLVRMMLLQTGQQTSPTLGKTRADRVVRESRVTQAIVMVMAVFYVTDRFNLIEQIPAWLSAL